MPFAFETQSREWTKQAEIICQVFQSHKCIHDIVLSSRLQSDFVLYFARIQSRPSTVYRLRHSPGNKVSTARRCKFLRKPNGSAKTAEFLSSIFFRDITVSRYTYNGNVELPTHVDICFLLVWSPRVQYNGIVCRLTVREYRVASSCNLHVTYIHHCTPYHQKHSLEKYHSGPVVL